MRDEESSHFMTIKDLSIYLKIKPKSLYVKLAEENMPHFRIGRLIRFRRDEIDQWLESQRGAGVKQTIKVRTRMTKLSDSRIDRMVRKAIDREKGDGYTPSNGKPDQVEGSREVHHGTL
jgi:excisionase family DNA binding protein